MPRYIFALIAHKIPRLKPFQNERILVCCAQSHIKKKPLSNAVVAKRQRFEHPRGYRKRSAEQFDDCRARKPLSSPSRGRTNIFYKVKNAFSARPIYSPGNIRNASKIIVIRERFFFGTILAISLCNQSPRVVLAVPGSVE